MNLVSNTNDFPVAHTHLHTYIYSCTPNSHGVHTWSMTDSRSLLLAFQKSISVTSQGYLHSSSGWAELFLSTSLIRWDHSITTDSTECRRLRSESWPLEAGRGQEQR